jgi:hypothetical protein
MTSGNENFLLCIAMKYSSGLFPISVRVHIFGIRKEAYGFTCRHILHAWYYLRIRVWLIYVLFVCLSRFRLYCIFVTIFSLQLMFFFFGVWVWRDAAICPSLLCRWFDEWMGGTWVIIEILSLTTWKILHWNPSLMLSIIQLFYGCITPDRSLNWPHFFVTTAYSHCQFLNSSQMISIIIFNQYTKTVLTFFFNPVDDKDVFPCI